MSVLIYCGKKLQKGCRQPLCIMVIKFNSIFRDVVHLRNVAEIDREESFWSHHSACCQLIWSTEAADCSACVCAAGISFNGVTCSVIDSWKTQGAMGYSQQRTGEGFVFMLSFCQYWCCPFDLFWPLLKLNCFCYPPTTLKTVFFCFEGPGLQFCLVTWWHLCPPITLRSSDDRNRKRHLYCVIGKI